MESTNIYSSVYIYYVRKELFPLKYMFQRTPCIFSQNKQIQTFLDTWFLLLTIPNTRQIELSIHKYFSPPIRHFSLIYLKQNYNKMFASDVNNTQMWYMTFL